MLPEPRTRFSFSDVESSRLKLSEEEAAPPPSPEEQLKEMPKAGEANAHTITMHGPTSDPSVVQTRGFE